MGARNEDLLPAVETEAVGASERLTWVRPEVRRLAAGSAEDGPSGDVDAATNLS